MEVSVDPSPLKIKEVWVKDRHYVVCLNEEERRKDAHDREAIVARLKERLRRGDKALLVTKATRYRARDQAFRKTSRVPSTMGLQ
jgi:hypothetical protein